MEQTPNLAALTNDSTLNPASPVPAPTPVSVAPVCEELPAAGTPPCDLAELSTSQVKALEALAAGRSFADAARDAGVNPGSLYRWRKTDPRFIVALNAWRIEAATCARDRVLALGDEATRAAHRLLRKDNASVTIAILKSLGSFSKIKPGTTDIDEAADALRQEERKRGEAHWSRLLDEAKEIRSEAQCALWRRQGMQKKLEETRALVGKQPESVLRELRRADELEVEANGLPTADDIMPQPPANKPAAIPAGK